MNAHLTRNKGLYLRSVARAIIIGVITVAVLPYFLTFILFGSHLCLDVGIHERIHINDVLSTVLASLCLGASRASVGGAKLEVHKTLLVHAIVVLAVVVLVVLVVVVAVLAAKVSTVILFGHGAVLKPDRVVDYPSALLVVVVVVLNTTRGGEDATAERR